jgi:hypothetical protein
MEPVRTADVDRWLFELTQVAFPALLKRYPDIQLADGARRRDSLPVTC